MHVLICTFTYPPNRDGVAAASEAMAQGLKRLGHDVTIATAPLKSRVGDPPIEGGLVVGEFDGECPDPSRRKQERDRLQTWIEGNHFDVIVCHCWYTWPAEVLDQMDERRKPPVVLVSHGYTAHLIDWAPTPFWGMGVWARGMLKVCRLPQTLRRYTWVTFLSERADFGRFFDLWVARRIGYERYSIIPNGTYPERFDVPGAPFREAYGITEALVFLCVANYSTRKNQEMAVRAFRRAKLAGAVLVFIGSELGDYGRALQALDRELATEQPLGRVLLLEKVSQQLTTAAYVACDAFVLSAKVETQPIVLIESMAAGKPWISTNSGCIREMPGGIVVSIEDELVTALRRLATHPELRKELGSQGKEASRWKYTWDAAIAAYDTLLRQLVSAHSATSHPS